MVSISSNIEEFEKDLNDFEKDIARNTLTRLGLLIEAEVIDQITIVGAVDTSRFRGSVRSRQFTPSSILISDGVTYGNVIERGRLPGKMPPLEPLKDWARRVLGDENAAFPVAKKIARKGIQGRFPFKRAVDKVKAQIEESIKENRYIR